MDKSLIAHTVLAVAAVGIAYAAWKTPTESPKATVIVVSGSVDRLTQVEFEEEKFRVVLSRRGNAMTVSTTAKNTDDTQRNISDFPMSDKGPELLSKLAPLKAERSLGKPEPARLAEVGLDAPTQTLTLHFGERAVKLDVGNATFGATNYFVRDENGELFLVPSTTITPLKTGGASLIERMALDLKREQVEQVVIESDGSSRTLVHKNAGERGQSFFADVSTPDTKIDNATGWVDGLLRLRALSAAPEVPSGEPKLAVVLRGDDGRERTVKVWEPSGETVLVTSTTFPKGIIVSRSTVQVLFRDVKLVLTAGRGGEAPRSEAPASDVHAEAR